MRKMLFEQADIVHAGGEPMNVFRDTDKNDNIVLPLETFNFGVRRLHPEPPAADGVRIEDGVSEDEGKLLAVRQTWVDYEQRCERGDVDAAMDT